MIEGIVGLCIIVGFILILAWASDDNPPQY